MADSGEHNVQRRTLDAGEWALIFLIRWLPTLAALFGVAATLELYFPGSLSNDSVTQYRHVLSGSWDNGKPLVMQHLWSLTNQAI